MFRPQKGSLVGSITSFERFEQVSVSLPAANLTISSPSFHALARMVDRVRAQSNVPDEDVLLEIGYDSTRLRLNMRVDLAAPWNKAKELEYLDHPVENGTVVVFDEATLAGNEPMMAAMMARERVEIQLGVRSTHRVKYGRVTDEGHVFLPGLGTYSAHAFRVVRLLEKEENGYFKEG